MDALEGLLAAELVAVIVHVFDEVVFFGCQFLVCVFDVAGDVVVEVVEPVFGLVEVVWCGDWDVEVEVGVGGDHGHGSEGLLLPVLPPGFGDTVVEVPACAVDEEIDERGAEESGEQEGAGEESEVGVAGGGAVAEDGDGFGVGGVGENALAGLLWREGPEGEFGEEVIGVEWANAGLGEAEAGAVVGGDGCGCVGDQFFKECVVGGELGEVGDEEDGERVVGPAGLREE